MIWIAYNALSVALVAAAVTLALNGIDGWGWLIFAALITSVVPKSSD